MCMGLMVIDAVPSNPAECFCAWNSSVADQIILVDGKIDLDRGRGVDVAFALGPIDHPWARPSTVERLQALRYDLFRHTS